MFEADEDEFNETVLRPAADKADMWEIARYIEEHPEDYEQRWRLAKKMYLSWEYRHALEHLLVLKNEWNSRLNVLRYLAATYYRLGRYEEAIGELEEALERWPNEVGLREQLARVREIAGDRLGASQEWEQIANLQPEHPTANSAIKRLVSVPGNTPREDLGIGNSDSGVDLKIGVLCPQCGAQNSTEETRCWQCNEPLGNATPTSDDLRRRQSPIASGPSLETLVTLTGAVAFIFTTLCLYLSVRLLMADRTGDAAAGYQSLLDLYQHGLARTRLTFGATVYIGWPAALWLSLNYFDVKLRVPPTFVTVTALAAAGLTYLCTWLPPNAMLLAVVLPPAASGLLIIGAFQLEPKRAVQVWATHLAMLALLIPSVWVVSERLQFGRFFNPFVEAPAVLSFARAEAVGAHVGPIAVDDTEVPIMQKAQWTSTGSDWLDTHAGQTGFTVISNQYDNLVFEIKDDTGTIHYEDVRKEHWNTAYPVQPDEVYEIIVNGEAGATAELQISGLMRCELLP